MDNGILSRVELDENQRAAQAQFARQSDRYGSGHILAEVSDVAESLARMELQAPGDVLDIATGAGHTGLFFAGLGFRVILADIAEPMLERSRETALSRGLQVETRLHSAEDLPYEEDSFDLVTCRVAAHHFSDPHAFVSESARVMRSGGWFLLIDGSVPDNEPVAESWTHEVEKLRDPSHGRFLTPGQWLRLCEGCKLEVREWKMTPFKQPDLEWYFETAATSPENREKVLQLVRNAPAEARRLFKVGEEDGKIVWWWQRLTLMARKN